MDRIFLSFNSNGNFTVLWNLFCRSPTHGFVWQYMHCNTAYTHIHIRKGGIQYNNYTELYKRGPNCHEMHSTRAFQCLALPNKHAGH